MIFNICTSKARKAPVLNASYPADVTVNAGASATFKVAIATDGYPKKYTYQWYVNGSAVSGATGISFTYAPASPGSYTVSCKVTNGAGTVTSRTATLKAAYVLAQDGTLRVSGSIQKETGTFEISGNTLTCYGGTHRGGYFWPVDVTNYSKLQLAVEFTNRAYNTVEAGVFDSEYTSGRGFAPKKWLADTGESVELTKTVSGTLDISAVTGTCNVGVQLLGGAGAGSPTAVIKTFILTP